MVYRIFARQSCCNTISGVSITGRHVYFYDRRTSAEKTHACIGGTLGIKVSGARESQLNAVQARYVKMICFLNCTADNKGLFHLTKNHQLSMPVGISVDCYTIVLYISRNNLEPYFEHPPPPKSKRHDGNIYVRKVQPCKRFARVNVHLIRFWPPWRDERSGVLIGADGTRRSDWSERVY